jgi:hypothetical protein
MGRYVGAENGVDGSAGFDPVRKDNHREWRLVRRFSIHHDGDVWLPYKSSVLLLHHSLPRNFI